MSEKADLLAAQKFPQWRVSGSHLTQEQQTRTLTNAQDKPYTRECRARGILVALNTYSKDMIQRTWTDPWGRIWMGEGGTAEVPHFVIAVYVPYKGAPAYPDEMPTDSIGEYWEWWWDWYLPTQIQTTRQRWGMERRRPGETVTVNFDFQ